MVAGNLGDNTKISVPSVAAQCWAAWQGAYTPEVVRIESRRPLLELYKVKSSGSKLANIYNCKVNAQTLKKNDRYRNDHGCGSL